MYLKANYLGYIDITVDMAALNGLLDKGNALEDYALDP